MGCHSWVIGGGSEAELLTNDTHLLNYNTSVCYIDSTMTPGVIAELREVSLMPLSQFRQSMLICYLKSKNSSKKRF